MSPIFQKTQQTLHPPLSMHQQQINEVDMHKHLGLTFTCDGTWHAHLHVTEIKSKAWYRINIMRQLNFVLDRKSLQSIYFSFIHPVLEYADVVRDNCIQYEANELEKIQIEAARIVTGSTKLVSIDALYTETGWETLESRRNKHKLTLFYKMKVGMSPHYLTTLIPPIVGNTYTYNLRNANDIGTVQANS